MKIKHLCILSLVATALLFSSCASVGDGTVATGPSLGKLGLVKSGQTYNGKMSWYSVKTNGGTATASGERFSNNAQTAAHKTLPLGTMVQVTNLNNNKSAVVRINDRGPYIPGRIIDVSIGVAGQLDFVNSGVVPCKVEVLKPIGSGLKRSALFSSQ